MNPNGVSPILVEQTIRKCSAWRLGIAWKEVIAFCNWAAQQEGYAHTPEVYHQMLDLLGKVSEFDIAWNLMDEIRKQNVLITEQTFAILIRRYVGVGRVNEAVNAFYRMEQYGCDPNSIALAKVLDLLCERKHVREAQNFFEGLRGRFKPDCVSYTILVNGWSRVGDFNESVRVLREMKESGVQPNVSTFSVLIEGFCRKGELDQAWVMLRKMIASGCATSAAGFNALMRAHFKADQRDKALKVHNEMKRLRIQPDVVTYNLLMEIHCRDNKLDVAHKVLNQMIGKGVMPNARTFSALFKRICKMRDVNGAHKLYTRMKELNCVPNVASYNALMQMFSEMKSTDMVLKLRKEMEENGCETNFGTYRTLIGMHCQFGNWNQSYLLFKDMTEVKCMRPPLDIYRMVLDVLRKAGQMQKHEQLADIMDAKGFFPRAM